MYLKPIHALPNGYSRNIKAFNNSIRTILYDFCESDLDYAEVVYNDDEYASSGSVYSGMRYTVKRLELPVSVRLIQGSVYLVREGEQDAVRDE